MTKRAADDFAAIRARMQELDAPKVVDDLNDVVTINFAQPLYVADSTVHTFDWSLPLDRQAWTVKKS